MAPRITIVGGGSAQWAPKLVLDLANTPVLRDCEVVLEDVDAASLVPVAALVERIADVRGTAMRARTTTDQRDAMRDADFVVVNISTGGFASMRHDLDVPARYGIRQSVGDTVGPGGISRALRNIPVLLSIARDMEELCPGAWLLNLTNPMTTLCRAVTRETSVRTVGLCHEVTILRHTLSSLLDAPVQAIDLEITGVNHLPVATRCVVHGADADRDGLAELRDLVEQPDGRGREPLWLGPPEVVAGLDIGSGYEWSKQSALDAHRVKLELLRRFGALPAAGDRHVVEFFAGFLTPESGWGRRWGVGLTAIEDRERSQGEYEARLDELRTADPLPGVMSGEMVAPVVEALSGGARVELPLNVPNHGQCPDLPDASVVESMCRVDASGVRGRDRARAPVALAAHLGRIVASQELTVEAALTGDREQVFEAMLLDPLAGRGDVDGLQRMTDELLSATAAWLPQFA